MARRDTKTLGFAVEDGTDGRDGDDDDDERGEHDGPRSALRHAETKDFIDAGLEPEFIGRIPVRVACDPLGEGELRRILVESKGSVLRQFEDDLGGYNISLACDDDALTQLARLAAAEKTGARGLLTVLERTLRDFGGPSTPSRPRRPPPSARRRAPGAARRADAAGERS